MKALICPNCGKTGRPRHASKLCPFCNKGTMEEYKPKEIKPISVETIFKKSAEDKNIRVSEKSL